MQNFYVNIYVDIVYILSGAGTFRTRSSKHAPGRAYLLRTMHIYKNVYVILLYVESFLYVNISSMYSKYLTW